MIISDLNYLEDATQDVVGGTGIIIFCPPPPPRPLPTAPGTFNNSFSITGLNSLSSSTNLGANYAVTSSVTGTSGSLAGDNNAYGTATNVQTNFSQVVIGGYSSQNSVTAIASATPL
ncbi:hypothetical protein [Planktothrix agardhii]|uniref:hypothetical protein n=1 Tax=Planktothrix agardhii TaxID=1160 RepID=UPI001BDFB834|nr:hypothetical protein [Planktothrix agardhii]